MQPRHTSISQHAGRPAPFPAQRLPSPTSLIGRVPTPLSLPDISGQPPGFMVGGSKVTGAVNLVNFAENLVDFGVLKSEHWTGKLGSSCETALAALCNQARPNPIHRLTLSFTDNGEALGNDCYAVLSGTPDGNRVPVTEFGAFCLVMTSDSSCPTILDIGTTLRNLEATRPQLGQTVMLALDRGLHRSCRGLTPRAGYDWCQGTYWRSESDEKELMEELRTEYPQGTTDERIHEEYNIYTRKSFDEAIPGWAGSGKISPLSLAELTRYEPKPRHRKIIEATRHLLTELGRIPAEASKWDRMEHVGWEICPYVLRWEHGDPLGQIWDDTMNPLYETGDVMMDMNAAFCFWDKESMRSAVKRLPTYLHFMQLTENLITTIGKELP